MIFQQAGRSSSPTHQSERAWTRHNTCATHSRRELPPQPHPGGDRPESDVCVVWILQVWGGGRRAGEGARRQARAQVGSAAYTHEKKRRFLLVSEGCPWCRASGMGYIVFRTTKGLKKAMTCSRLAPPKVVQKIHDLAVSAALLIDHSSLAAVKLMRAVVVAAGRAEEVPQQHPPWQGAGGGGQRGHEGVRGAGGRGGEEEDGSGEHGE